MTEKEKASNTVYSSFEEFRNAFYPESSKDEKSTNADDPSGRELARYAVGKHLPGREDE